MQDQPVSTMPNTTLPDDQQLVLPAPVMPDTIITPSAPLTAPTMPIQPAAPAPQTVAPAAPAVPMPLQAPVPQQSAMAATPQPAAAPAAPVQAPAAPVPLLADDGDLIEKEWVGRVQQIVAATAQDPYAQNQQISQLKVEYLQKRYGKVVKLGN